ncbi:MULTISPECIES: DNA-processing protein DprA [unclassified Acinetobacter]|uniref:DNA-processing protein DprA n=1 Tax=unclassified Acinetobacter TaxID=196816 RepID=UPI0035BB0C92
MMQTLNSEQINRICLWHLLQHSLSSYNKITAYFDDISLALRPDSIKTWQQLNLHKNHIERLQQHFTPQGQQNFQHRLDCLSRFCDDVLFCDDEDYPQSLQPYEDKPPMLFVRGDARILNQAQIAIVGSRQISPQGGKVAFDFADYFSSQNFITVSGLASGIDAAAHRGAIKQGKTIAVIATGLDECYPSEHLALWQNIIDAGGAVMSEFLPFTPPHKANFPRRNRIISGMSLGTLVIEAGLKSGSLITAKAALEQGKQVFAIPGHIYSQYHQGCHQLIREGATLVDQPNQVIEDLTMFDIAHYRPVSTAPTRKKASNANTNSTMRQPQTATQAISAEKVEQPIDIPLHLQDIYQKIDWTGISVDDLAISLNIGISELNVALLELELLGVCKAHAGRYVRI